MGNARQTRLVTFGEQLLNLLPNDLPIIVRLMKTIYLMPFAMLLGAAAFAQSALAPVYILNCHFSEDSAKGRDRECTATAIINDSLKIKCSGRDEVNYGVPLSSSHSLANSDFGLSLVTAAEPNSNQNHYPAIYVDADIFKQGFTSAPANLRLTATSRALHGTCEKGETQ